MNIGHHHWSKRQIAKNSTNKPLTGWKKYLDKIILLSAVFGPLTIIPQVLKIWVDQNASGVSVISWGGFLIGAIFWMLYGVAHRQLPIIIANSITLVFTFLIVLGAILLGNSPF